MTNHLQLPQDTLDRLSMLGASQEEREAALAKLVLISKDDLYQALDPIPIDMKDGIWQRVKEAGASAQGVSKPDRPDGDELRTFNIAGTILRRTVNIFTIACESAEIADRVANQLRTPTRDGAEGAGARDWVNCPICGESDMRCETFDEGATLIRCTNNRSTPAAVRESTCSTPRPPASAAMGHDSAGVDTAAPPKPAPDAMRRDRE